MPRHQRDLIGGFDFPNGGAFGSRFGFGSRPFLPPAVRPTVRDIPPRTPPSIRSQVAFTPRFANLTHVLPRGFLKAKAPQPRQPARAPIPTVLPIPPRFPGPATAPRVAQPVGARRTVPLSGAIINMRVGWWRNTLTGEIRSGSQARPPSRMPGWQWSLSRPAPVAVRPVADRRLPLPIVVADRRLPSVAVPPLPAISLRPVAVPPLPVISLREDGPRAAADTAAAGAMAAEPQRSPGTLALVGVGLLAAVGLWLWLGG